MAIESGTATDPAVRDAAERLDRAIEEARKPHEHGGLPGVLRTVAAYDRLIALATDLGAAERRAENAAAWAKVEEAHRSGASAHERAMAEAGTTALFGTKIFSSGEAVLKMRGVSLAALLAPYRDDLRLLGRALNAVG